MNPENLNSVERMSSLKLLFSFYFAFGMFGAFIGVCHVHSSTPLTLLSFFDYVVAGFVGFWVSALVFGTLGWMLAYQKIATTQRTRLESRKRLLGIEDSKNSRRESNPPQPFSQRLQKFTSKVESDIDYKPDPAPLWVSPEVDYEKVEPKPTSLIRMIQFRLKKIFAGKSR